MKRLPDKIILALARYYHHRNANAEWGAKESLATLCLYVAGTNGGIRNEGEKPQFNKEADLKHIGEVAAKYDFGWTASAGTFWFTRKHRKGFLQFQVNERNYLDSGTKQYRKVA